MQDHGNVYFEYSNIKRRLEFENATVKMGRKIREKRKDKIIFFSSH